MQTCNTGKVFTIIQGYKPRAIIVKLIDPTSGDPFILTGATDIQTEFLSLDGSILTLGLVAGGVSVLSAEFGKVSIQLTAAQTALLQTVSLATLQVSVSFGGDPAACQIANAYSVVSAQPNP